MPDKCMAVLWLILLLVCSRRRRWLRFVVQKFCQRKHWNDVHALAPGLSWCDQTSAADGIGVAVSSWRYKLLREL